jgi:hypothetical protein
MDSSLSRSLTLVVALLAAAAGAWFLYRPTSSADLPPVEPAPAEVASRSPAPAAPAAPADPRPQGATPEEALGAVIASARPQVGPSTAAFASPDEAERYVRTRVEGLLGQIAPEVRPEDLEEDCADDGRTCTYHAPWPGDDLLKRWLKAIAEGRTSSEALGGVKFTRFAKTDDGRLEIVAHAP